MEDLMTLNIAELMFKYYTSKKEYKRAYAEFKAVEEEIERRGNIKMQESIRTKGENGVREQLDKEMEIINGDS